MRKLVQTPEQRVSMRRLRRDAAIFSSKDHVTHYHASGEDRYLCGKLYERRTQHTGTDRPARNTQELTCNRCQVIHNNLLLTKEGRQRLGVDKYAWEPIASS